MRWFLALAWASCLLTTSTVWAGDQPPVFVLKWGTLGSEPGQFNTPWEVDVDSEGQVYVADMLNHRIQKFDSAGTFLAEWGSFGSGEGQFNRPMSIGVDSDGEVFVGDISARIQVFTSAGVYLRQWSLAAGGDCAEALEVGSDGSIYVLSNVNSRVLVFSNQGALQTLWGSPGFDDGEFSDPIAIAVDSQDDVYVSDAGRIQKFTSDGVFILKWTGLGFGLEAMASDIDDNIYVTSPNPARVRKFTNSGVYLTEWGSFGAGDGEFFSPFGIAAGPSREIYVVDASLHRVQKFAHSWISVEPESWGKIKGRYRTTR